MMALPGKDIVRAKKVLSYVEKVNKMDLNHTIMDARTESLLRTAMNLPEEKRNVMGIIETLGVGIFTARRLMVVIKTLRANEPKPSPEEAEEDSSLNASPPEPEGMGGIGRTDHASRAEAQTCSPRAEAVTGGGIQVESGVPPMEKRPTREPIMFGDEQKDLYQTFYNQEKRPRKVDSSEVQGRRCLFHGEAAVTACTKCSSLLCDECVRGRSVPALSCPDRGSGRDEEIGAEEGPKGDTRGKRGFRMLKLNREPM